MDFREIRRLIKKKDYLISEHADEERTKDRLSLKEIEEAILAGEVIEERLDDPRGESRLVAGKTKGSRWVHVVIGVRLNKPVLVTVYLPSQEEWIGGKIRV